MYESPVKLFIGEIKHQVDEKMEEACYTAVIEYFPHVDRAELMKALEYDRGQYEQGYQDAKNEIVRCYECKHSRTYKCKVDPMYDRLMCYKDDVTVRFVEDDFYCAYGERKTENERRTENVR